MNRVSTAEKCRCLHKEQADWRLYSMAHCPWLRVLFVVLPLVKVSPFLFFLFIFYVVLTYNSRPKWNMCASYCLKADFKKIWPSVYFLCRYIHCFLEIEYYLPISNNPERKPWPPNHWGCTALFAQIFCTLLMLFQRWRPVWIAMGSASRLLLTQELRWRQNDTELWLALIERI